MPDLPHGASLRDLTMVADDRGSFRELFRESWFEGARPVVQTNLSTSAAGVLRGMHFHRAQADVWSFVEGEAFVALVDLRQGSPSSGARWWHTFSAARPQSLFVPPGVAHGFYAVEPCSLLYHVDAAFDGGNDEFGFAWDDPDVAIPWPVEGTPVLSDRDRSNPSLADVLADPPAFTPA